ncbi:sugar ABC transporter ATP-binding protein [Leucobacter sp. GX24907]
MSSKLFELQGLRKSYGSVRALRWDKESAIRLQAGDVLGLAGENGAGKSTLLGAISGSLRLDSGEMRFDGTDFAPTGPFDALDKGVALIPQETLLSPTLTIAENVLLGREKEYTVGGTIIPSRRDRLAREALNAIGADYPLHSVVSGLPIEHRKMIELARALAANPKVLLVDETSNVLSRDGAVVLFDEIRRFAANGGAVIFVTHRLDEIVEHCNRVAILKDGAFVREALVTETDEAAISRSMVGRDLEVLAVREARADNAEEAAAALSVVNLQADGCSSISFSVRAGEVLGIGGLVGCGADKVIRALAGADKANYDSITVSGMAVRGDGVRARIASGLAYVPKDRDEEGLLLFSSVQENLVLGSLDRFSKLGMISPQAGLKSVKSLIDRLNIKTPSAGTQVRNLSGGNRQKVLLARWLHRDVPVLLLNNPTRGVDVGAKGEIYELLDRARSDGKAVVVVSDELPELRRLADRVLIMKTGNVTADYNAPVPEEHDLIRAMI